MVFSFPIQKAFTAEHAEVNHLKDRIQKNLIFLGYFQFDSSLRSLRALR
jgi:hypothetical protein